MAGTKTNPDNVGGPNENYAQRVSLSPGLGIPMESGGLSFDRANFERVAGTKTVLDQNATAANPAGQSH